MDCSPNIITGVTGTPYLVTTNVSVSETAVNLALGFHPVPRLGDLTIRIATAIPDSTTGTLPVMLTLNGNSRPLTFFGGAAVTAADLPGTGIIKVFNDRFNGILQLMSVVAPAAATANETETTNP